MSGFKNRYHRKTYRLRGWDYGSNNYYFITICTRNRVCHFGRILHIEHKWDWVHLLSDLGKAAFSYWADIPKHFPMVSLDAFIVMPNHVHGIIRILDPDCACINQTIAGHDGNDDGGTNDVCGGNNCGDDGCGGDDVPVGTQNFASPRNGETIKPKYREYKPNKFGPQSRNLASIIRGYKAGVKKFATMNGIEFAWQPRYYDIIIRDKKALYRIRQYILNNPEKWMQDKFYNDK